MIFDNDYPTICDKARQTFFDALGRYSYAHFGDESGPGIAAELDMRISCANELFAAAESPIEEIVAALLPFINTGYDYVNYDCGPNPKFGAVVRPQHEIAGYRVDFLISCYARPASRHVVIECDGHAFHEKTKEQVARDKSRDRKIVAAGAVILRFSGSEIYRNPVKVHTEISETIQNSMEDALEEAGLVRRSKRRKSPDGSGD